MPKFTIKPSIETDPEALFLERVEDLNQEQFEALCNMQRRGIDLVWHNAQFSPQECCDKMGDGAADVFKRHGLLTQLILTLAQMAGIPIEALITAPPGGQPMLGMPTNEFAYNEDGTVIIYPDIPYGQGAPTINPLRPEP